jgi:undecaprenyl-diphosphatase
MNESTALSIFTWLGEHPVLSGFFIFFIALIESLAIVGILVPGVIFMLIIGAYLATDQFSFIYAIILTFAGAVAGDAISYYLGYRYKNKLTTVWPISRYPNTFKKGIQFFNRHGMKSVILGRFIGPIRPIIPAIAGMFEMPRKQFFISNIFSALIWAPVILLPGYVIGLSLEFAGDITARLLILVIVFGGLLWITFTIIKFIYLQLLPRFDTGVSQLLRWSHQHPLPGKIPGILLEKKYSDKNIFTLLFIIYILFCFIFFVLPTQYGLLDTSNNIDLIFKNIFLTLDSPASNHFVISILNLLNLYWIITLSLLTFILILLKKHTILFRYYLFTLVLTVLLQLILNIFFNIDQNNNLLAISTYFFLTFLLTVNSSTRRKILYFGICYVIIAATMIAQLYHGSALSTSLLLSNLFSLLWIIILTSTYRHHCSKSQHTYQFQRKTGLFFLVIILSNVFIIPSSFHFELLNSKKIIIENNIWEKYISIDLPLYRKGFIHSIKHPFNIQWIDSKKNITKKMKSLSNANNKQWEISNPATIPQILQLLNPKADIKSLPIFSHLNNGVYEQLRFIHIIKNKNRQPEILVIRLWQTNFKIKQFNPDKKAKPLWHGTLTKLVIVKRLGIQILQSRLIDDSQFQKVISKFKNPRKIVIHQNNKILLLK